MGFFFKNKTSTPGRRSSQKPPYIISDNDVAKLNDEIQLRIDSETDVITMMDHWHDRIKLLAEKMGQKKLSNDISSIKWAIKGFSIKINKALIIGKDDGSARMQYGTMMGAYIGCVLNKVYKLNWNSDSNESASGFCTLKINEKENFDIIHATIDWSHKMNENELLNHLNYITSKVKGN